MTKRVRFEPAMHACPTCNEPFKILGEAKLAAGSLGIEFPCDQCSALVSVRVNRRGDLRLSNEPLKSLRTPDGGPLTKVWSGPGGDPGRVLRGVVRDLDGELRLAGGFQTVPGEVRLPVIWTPGSAAAARVPLTPGVARLTVSCRCPECRKLLTKLVWGGGREGAGNDPPPGVIVIDTLLKDRKPTLARLDQHFREQRRAAALLVCRKCSPKTEVAYVFREPRSLRPLPLDRLMQIVEQ